MKYLTIIFILMIISTTSCDLEVEPSDLATIDALLIEEGGITTATNGTYALFKDVLPFRGQEFGNSNNDYTRHLYQMTEFASDNVMYTQFSSDPLYLVFTREHFADMENSSYFWFIAYRMILGTNLIIENAEEGQDAVTDHVIGENYFLRALASFDLLRLFAKSYNEGIDNLGIVTRNSLSTPNILERSTVGEGYELVISDLKKAESLMSPETARGVEFGSQLAAQALLSRVYLYMGEDDMSIAYADKVINNSTGTQLASTTDYLDNFANTSSSSESIFVIKFTQQDHRAKNGSIGSMYFDDGNNNGWGEVFASGTYLDIIRDNPEDIRNELVLSTGKLKSGYPVHYITKFSGQDGIVNLASPQYLRLSEIYLNRAEAYAKTGNLAGAIEDVNTIRERAGLSGEKLYDHNNMSTQDVLDAALNERRLELAFEGHRVFDLRRNELDLVRDYIGIHTESGDTRTSIPWNDDRNIFFIPNIEIVTNPDVVQNQ